MDYCKKNKQRTQVEEDLQLKLVLPKVGLDIGAMSSGNSAVLRFGS